MARTMNMLGLVGGLSWRSTIEYYRMINQATNDHFSANVNPPLAIANVDQSEVHALQAAGRWHEIGTLLGDAADRLATIGAQCILLCSNTSHRLYDQVSARIAVPLLHIGDTAGGAITLRGIEQVGLLGTIFTMEEDFLRDRLKGRHGVSVLTPRDRRARRKLHEMAHAFGAREPRPSETAYLRRQAEQLIERGAEGILLGCTEFPLALNDGDLPVPVFDTARLHAAAAAEFVLAGRLP